MSQGATSGEGIPRAHLPKARTPKWTTKTDRVPPLPLGEGTAGLPSQSGRCGQRHGGFEDWLDESRVFPPPKDHDESGKCASLASQLLNPENYTIGMVGPLVANSVRVPMKVWTCQCHSGLRTRTAFPENPRSHSLRCDQSTDLGVRALQDFNFQVYEIGGLTAGETLNLSVSGTPRETDAASTPGETISNQNLLIGAGALGVALILAGAWMYLRDRNREEDPTDEQEEGHEFDSSDEVIDAIIALDDLHRSKKISDAAYQKRRAELKES